MTDDPLPEHTDLKHCPAFVRNPEEYGDVTLSVQASWGHYCKLAEEFIPPEHAEFVWGRGRLGCAHIPLEHYDTVEIGLWWTNVEVAGTLGPFDFGDIHVEAHAYVTNKWITKPSEDLGIEGFDDLWEGDDIGGFVPLRRAGELQVALMMRARQLSIR